MEETPQKVALNKALIEKIDSMVMDIKFYVNTNVSIASSQPDGMPVLSPEDVTELMQIRGKLKVLSKKLKDVIRPKPTVLSMYNLPLALETLNRLVAEGKKHINNHETETVKEDLRKFFSSVSLISFKGPSQDLFVEEYYDTYNFYTKNK